MFHITDALFVLEYVCVRCLCQCVFVCWFVCVSMCACVCVCVRVYVCYMYVFGCCVIGWGKRERQSDIINECMNDNIALATIIKVIRLQFV